MNSRGRTRINIRIRCSITIGRIRRSRRMRNSSDIVSRMCIMISMCISTIRSVSILTIPIVNIIGIVKIRRCIINIRASGIAGSRSSTIRSCSRICSSIGIRIGSMCMINIRSIIIRGIIRICIFRIRINIRVVLTRIIVIIISSSGI